MSWADDRIDHAAAALRADKASDPVRYRKVGTIVLDLLAGIHVNDVPAAIAPSAQQQMCPDRAAERRLPCSALVTLTPHGVPIPRPARTRDRGSARTLVRIRLPLALNLKQNCSARSVSTWISTAGCSLVPRRVVCADNDGAAGRAGLCTAAGTGPPAQRERATSP